MRQDRLHWGALALAVVASAVVVTVAFNPVPHTGGDNAGYIALAHGLLERGTYTDVFDPEGLPHTKYPPVFPMLLAGLIALGARTWVALKMTAAVSTVAAVALTYLLAARTLGTLAGLGVALLLAMSSGIVYYSHWVLSDPLFLALTLASLCALGRAEPLDGEKREVSRSRPAAGAPRVNVSELGFDEPPSEPRARVAGSTLWLVLGVVSAGLAYFTRSAGLPLIVAVLGWLLLRRRWRAAAGSAIGLGLPMLGWWLRGRGEGVAQYATEFWLVDPYQPRLGSVGVFGLIPRVVENLTSYVLTHIPAGIVGGGGPALSEIGVAVAVAAIAGWVVSARNRVGPMELFFPLYAGLILLWPTVWGGDRFALPLFPVAFFYGAVAIRAAVGRLPEVAAGAVAAAALLALFLPAAGNWLESSRESSACAELSRENGVWACYGPRVAFYAAAASWAAEGLPEGSAVLSRKPRLFYLLSGHPSRTFPFDEGARAHLDLADRLGARYVLLDQWDGLAERYVGAAVRERPGAYCYIGAFGSAEQGGAQLLGILPPESRSGGSSAGGLAVCPNEYAVDHPAEAESSSGRIPLLAGLDS